MWFFDLAINHKSLTPTFLTENDSAKFLWTSRENHKSGKNPVLEILNLLQIILSPNSIFETGDVVAEREFCAQIWVI